jgi:hypothetical protein
MTDRQMCNAVALGLSLLLLSLAAQAATLNVTSSADAGPNTLRDALTNAADGDAITFNLPNPATLNLNSELVCNKNLIIRGPGAERLILSGQGLYRVLHITAGTTYISSCTIANGSDIAGSVMYGGGVLIDAGGSLYMDQCVVQHNYADGQGAGIYSTGVCLEINRSIIQDNVVYNMASFGGAIWANNSGAFNVYNSTLANNHSGLSGGCIEAAGAPMHMFNTTVSGNLSAAGGAVNVGNAVICNSTITNNQSYNESGGLVASAGNVRLQNTILAGNSSAHPNGHTDFQINYGGLVTSNGYNVIGSQGDAAVSWQSSDIVGTESSQVNPDLTALGNNGGYVQTNRPNAGSPVIDPADGNGAPFVDGRGYLRTNTADRGACEYNGQLPVALPGNWLDPTSLVAHWQAVGGVLDYALDISTDASFASVLDGWGNSLVGNATSVVVPGLSAGITYYYRVRAINGVYQSFYSNTVSSAYATPTMTPTATLTSTATETATITPTITATATLSVTPTVTMTATVTKTATQTATLTSTATRTPTSTSTPVDTRTVTSTLTPTSTATPTITPSVSLTQTVTATRISTPSSTPTARNPWADMDMTGKLFLAYPNPAREQVRFLVSPGRSVRVKITVLNANGERVGTVEDILPAGPGVVVWHCQDVAPGIYLARIFLDGREIGKTKVAVVR